MKTLSYMVVVLATVLAVLTVWMMATEPAAGIAKPQRVRTEIRVEPQVVWISAECPEGRRCI